jgi:hypothetical protein
MRPEVIAALVGAGIPLLAGACMLLVSYRVLGKKIGAGVEEWHSRHDRFLRVCGVIMIGLGVSIVSVLLCIVLAMNHLAGAQRAYEGPYPVSWQRHTTSDGLCSAEFPQPPTAATTAPQGIVTTSLSLYLPKPDISFKLTFSEIGENASAATDEERLDTIRDSLPAFMSQKGAKCVLMREERISDHGVPGRELEYSISGTHVFQSKIFILGRRIYRAIIVTPRARKDEENTRHFLDSLRFEPGGGS